MPYKSFSLTLFENGFFRPLTYLFHTSFIATLFFISLSFISLCLAEPQEKSTFSKKWVGTWSSAPQLVETANNPPSPGLSNNTIRQIVHPSIGGDSLRIRFSNEFSKSPVVMNSVHIAISKGNGTIDTTTDKVIYFGGLQKITMEPDSAVMSDPFQFALPPLTDVAITIYFGSTSPDITGHPGSRTTSYILTGNNVSTADFSTAVTTQHWYVINTIEVLTSDSANAVAILGDSITDGRGSDTDKQDRWPDELAIRLQANNNTRETAVLNEGIGGNCVLGFCLGPSALNRFQRDVLNQNGVKWLIILEGINDIGGAYGSQGSTQTAQNLIAAYGQFIDEAHVAKILVYGATLLPFGGSSYDSPDHQTAWQTVNDWIRHSRRFDAVIDFDSTMHDPTDTTKLLSIYDSGDHLHPSETGHQRMAETVDLTLFDNGITTVINEKAVNIQNRFSLLQNYPNPFNPSTIISFSIQKAGKVRITIYNQLGQQVALVTNKEYQAGNYSINFNAASLASGVYYYRIISDSFSQTKKMILLK
jgi:lysophospholipase L1-like esterase